MSINYESTVIGEVRTVQISGAPSVAASLLRFTLTWSIHPKRQHVYSVFGTNVAVSLTLQGSRETRFLGYATPETAWCDESREGAPVDTNLTYHLLLYADQLLALEHLRGNAGAVSFKLDMRGNATGPHGIRQIYESMELRVPASDWIRVLREAHASDVLLVGVDVPLNSESVEIRASIELVRRAHDHLLRGEFDAAVAECRRALESIWATQQLKAAGQAARKALSSTMDERRSMSMHDRRLALGEALINFAHPAHHVGAAGGPEIFSRRDAELAVASTASLVSTLATTPPAAH